MNEFGSAAGSGLGCRCTHGEKNPLGLHLDMVGGIVAAVDLAVTRDLAAVGPHRHRASSPDYLLTHCLRTRIILTMLETPIKDRLTERREATRHEIIDMAWQIAHERGLAQITLRDLAQRVGMRAPSLYTHFRSKNAIYDAMFGQAWGDFLEVAKAADAHAPRSAREALRFYGRTFFDFAVHDLARHQLMNQRTIVGFEPTPESYAPAVAVLEHLRTNFAALGVTRQEDLDLYVALVGGLVDAQLANDPGGHRWERLLDRAVDMYSDNLGL